MICNGPGISWGVNLGVSGGGTALGVSGSGMTFGSILRQRLPSQTQPFILHASSGLRDPGSDGALAQRMLWPPLVTVLISQPCLLSVFALLLLTSRQPWSHCGRNAGGGGDGFLARRRLWPPLVTILISQPCLLSVFALMLLTSRQPWSHCGRGAAFSGLGVGSGSGAGLGAGAGSKRFFKFG